MRNCFLCIDLNFSVQRPMLKFYYGCMFAGKTAHLINAFEIYQHRKFNPIIIKPAIDDREGATLGWGTTSSRLMPNKQVPAYYFKDLKKELAALDFGAIIVDEAQFLSREDVHYLAEIVDTKNINVLAYGLKTDVNGNLFTGSAALLAMADEVREMESLCQAPNCTNKAQMHARFIDGKRDRSGKSVAIEKGSVTYKSLCRKHWREL